MRFFAGLLLSTALVSLQLPWVACASEILHLDVGHGDCEDSKNGDSNRGGGRDGERHDGGYGHAPVDLTAVKITARSTSAQPGPSLARAGGVLPSPCAQTASTPTRDAAPPAGGPALTTVLLL